jgi:hypothetical protein
MSSGPDEIPSLVIRDCAAVFAEPLCFLFNLILLLSYEMEDFGGAPHSQKG